MKIPSSCPGDAFRVEDGKREPKIEAVEGAVRGASAALAMLRKVGGGGGEQD